MYLEEFLMGKIISISAFGETKTINGWCQDPRCQIDKHNLYQRIHRGDNIEKAITTPLSKRKYSFNEQFFDEWSENMSYILGFITADGCIKDNRGICYNLKIKLKSTDVEILEFIKSAVNYTGPILFQQGKRKETITYSCVLQLDSKYMIEKLREYYIVPQKTGKEILPNIPDNFKGDYLRGLFDGDGTIRDNKAGGRCLGIASANLSFLEDVKQILCLKYGNIHKNKLCQCYSLLITNKPHLTDIYHFMYHKNFNFSLKRKYDTYTTLLNNYKR